MFNVLLAAVLSLSNATDYVAITPASTSNMLQGVGIGSEGCYRTVRGEDADFLAEAVYERITAAAGYARGSGTKLGKVPQKRQFITGDDVTNSFALTTMTGTNVMNDTYSPDRNSVFGYVPEDFAVWTGFAMSESTNGWVRNGYDASTDIRALLGDDSTPYKTADLPSVSSLTGMVSFVGVTNLYALVEKWPWKTILDVSEVVFDSRQSRLTNEYYSLSHWIDKEIEYVDYQIDQDHWAIYYGSVRETGSRSSEDSYTYDLSFSKDNLKASSNTSIDYYGYPSVKKSSTGTTAGECHFVGLANPDFTQTRWMKPLPSSGCLITPSIAVGSNSRKDGYWLTNVTTRCYLVVLWNCQATKERYGSTGVKNLSYPYAWKTNIINRAISVTDLGIMSEHGRNGSPAKPMFVSSVTIDRMLSTALDAADASGAWPGGFYPATIQDRYLTAADYPASLPDGWSTIGGNTSSSTSGNIAENSIYPEKIYCLSVVKPVFPARVLGNSRK